jgi:hypothetical protein
MATLTLSITAELTDTAALAVDLATGEIAIADLPASVARDTALLSLTSGTWPRAIPLGSVSSPGLCVFRHNTSGGCNIQIGYERDWAAWSVAYPRPLDFGTLSVTEGDVIDIYINGELAASTTVGTEYDPLSDAIGRLTVALHALDDYSATRAGNVITIVGAGTLAITVEKNESAWAEVSVRPPVALLSNTFEVVHTLKPGQTLLVNLADIPGTPLWQPTTVGLQSISYLVCSAPA